MHGYLSTSLPLYLSRVPMVLLVVHVVGSKGSPPDLALGRSQSGDCYALFLLVESKRRTHLVASRSMSERYGIDVIRSWTSEVGLNGPGSTTAADCLRGAIYVCDSFDLSLRSVRGNPKGSRDLWHRCRQPGAAIQRRSFVRWSPPSIACAGFG